jgi:hypothetical protein
MNVTDALVNTGQFGMVTGFQNGRLPNRLGPCWKTEGGFGFSFQISFNLNDVDPAAIKVVRKTCFQTLYRDPTGLKQAEKDILTDPLGSEDSPDEKNVKREAYLNHKGEICGGKVTVWDAPGPRHLITQSPQYYPVEFRGRFEVQVLHEPTAKQFYTIEYLVAIRATPPQGAITHGTDSTKYPNMKFPKMFDVLRRTHGG